MTEAEWLAGTRSVKLLLVVRGRASNRKLRLFACACCRRLWEWITESDQRKQVEVTESYADGYATTEEWLLAFSNPDSSKPFVISSRHILAAATFCLGWSEVEDPNWKLNETARALIAHPWGAGAYSEFCTARVCDHAAQAAGHREGKPFTPQSDLRRQQVAVEREYAAQALLLHDIFGNPFRPTAFSPEWRTDTAVTLARQMYDARDFSAMPILADALQDSGCDSDDVLNHCRDVNQPHARGCWVVDRVLGKE